jgi:hypothetical protein
VAHCGQTYVWVNPGAMEGLSQFTLAVLDVCTVHTDTFHQPQDPPTAEVESTFSVGSDADKRTFTVKATMQAEQAPPTHDPETGQLIGGPITVEIPSRSNIPELTGTKTFTPLPSAPRKAAPRKANDPRNRPENRALRSELQLRR